MPLTYAMKILVQKENNFTPFQGSNLGHIAKGTSKSNKNGLNLCTCTPFCPFPQFPR